MPNKQKRPYRTISIIVPLNDPAKREKRQRNKKLYYLLRRLRYSLHRGNGNTYRRIEPQDSPSSAMPHGAYRLSAQLQLKLEDFLTFAPFTGFITCLQAESIASVVYLVEHKTNGKDVILPPIRISRQRPRRLTQPIPIGTEIDFHHIPYFARAGFSDFVDQPVEEYSAD